MAVRDFVSWVKRAVNPFIRFTIPLPLGFPSRTRTRSAAGSRTAGTRFNQEVKPLPQHHGHRPQPPSHQQFRSLISPRLYRQILSRLARSRPRQSRQALRSQHQAELMETLIKHTTLDLPPRKRLALVRQGHTVLSYNPASGELFPSAELGPAEEFQQELP